MPPRMASMNKLMVLPRRDAAMVACSREFAEVLLIKMNQQPSRPQAIKNQASQYCSSRRGLQSDASTLDDRG